MVSIYHSVGLLEAIRQRHSVRSFLPLQVGEHYIQEMLEAAVQAPTGLGMEPWAFAVVQDREQLRQLSDHAKVTYFRDRQAAKPAKRRRDDTINLIAENEEFNFFFDASTLIVICAPGREAFSRPDCWLAGQNLMLAAHGLGLGTCVIGSALGGLNTPYAKAVLNIPEHYEAVVPIVVGHPREHGEATPRRQPRILSWQRGRELQPDIAPTPLPQPDLGVVLPFAS
jgi:nitroreductase